MDSTILKDAYQSRVRKQLPRLSKIDNGAKHAKRIPGKPLDPFLRKQAIRKAQSRSR